MMISEPTCFTRRCKHFQGVVRLNPRDEASEVLVCTAFNSKTDREAIPFEIAHGENLHAEPLPGQGNDVIFEKEE